MNNCAIAYIVRLRRDRVHDAALAGVKRYAMSRGWGVEVFGWDEARRVFPGALRGAMRFVGFTVECSDLAPDLPRGLYGALPVVFMNCPSAPAGRRFVRFCADNEAIARLAFRELLAGKPSLMAVAGLRRGLFNWVDLRVRAFLEAAAAAGVECRAFEFASRHTCAEPGERERFTDWIAALPRHTAVFAANDIISADVVAAARAARRNIPRELTLLGVDNEPAVCEVSRPTLSSIQIDCESLGYLGAKALGELVAGRGGARAPAPTAVGPLMAVHRESTMGHGRREPRILEAVGIIRREACEGLTAGKLARRFRGSRRLFELRFREAIGHSILDEIIRVRLENAKTLLARTDTPVGIIADFCGFGTNRALQKTFLAREGMSMAEWRRIHGG